MTTTTESEKDMNTLAKEMVDFSIQQLVKNQSERKDGMLLYDTLPTEYKFPKSISSEKFKTRWKAFAEKKNLKKTKKPLRVFDEDTNKWIPRWGTLSKKNQEMREGIVVSNKTISQIKREKQKRIEKNKRNRELNIKRRSE